MDINEKFEAVNDDYLEFERVSNKKNKMRDVHAFILIGELFPDKCGDIISAASHDEIWLDVSEDEINSLTDESILELTRCGVRYCENNESLCMFA